MLKTMVLMLLNVGLLMGCLTMMLGIALLYSPSAHAHTISQTGGGSNGCENNATTINTTIYYSCFAQAQPCLTVREYPSLSAPELDCVAYGSSVYVYCQKTSSFPDGNIGGSNLWDNIYWTKTASLAFVPDVDVSTLARSSSSPIPMCQFSGG